VPKTIFSIITQRPSLHEKVDSPLLQVVLQESTKLRNAHKDVHSGASSDRIGHAMEWPKDDVGNRWFDS
jgi:hypothetical protein